MIINHYCFIVSMLNFLMFCCLFKNGTLDPFVINEMRGRFMLHCQLK